MSNLLFLNIKIWSATYEEWNPNLKNLSFKQWNLDKIQKQEFSHVITYYKIISH